MSKQYKRYKGMKKSTQIMLDIIIVILALIMIFCGYKIFMYFSESGKNNDVIDEIKEEVLVYPEENGSTESSVESVDDDGKPYTYPYHQPPESIDFDALFAKSPDVKGWLFSPNGVINYPVMQRKGDSEYYLDHLIDGSQNANGSLFIDGVNKGDFTDADTIIHGHSMKSGAMFGLLARYKRQYYVNVYPCFYLYTPTVNYRIDVFSAFETVTGDNMIFQRLQNNAEDKNAFIEYVKSRSKISTSVNVTAEDNFVTFNTCAYSSDDARFVVVGKLVPIVKQKPAENTEIP